MTPLLLLLLVPSTLTTSTSLDPLHTFYKVLHSMSWVMEGRGAPTPLFLTIRRAMWRVDPGLARSQERGWAGLLEYYRTGGGLGDPVGGSPTTFEERNTTLFPIHGGQPIVVYEPCNYASNVAYYQLVVALASPRHSWTLPQPVVTALAQASAALALGSAFMHASHTRLGAKADNLLISVMSYIMHQASLAPLPPSLLSPDLTDLAPSPRALTGVQIAQVVTDLYSTTPVTEWHSALSSLDMPRYEITFSSIISTLITLLLPPSLADPLVSALLGAFGIRETSTGTFIQQVYLPKIRRALARVRLPLLAKLRLLKNTLATVSKLVFAFFYQEQTFDIDVVTSPLGNQIGASVRPLSNSLSSLGSSLPALSPSLTLGRGNYPGEDWCSTSQPHSLWHSQSAAGLLDFFLLIDHLVSILPGKHLLT